MFTFINVFLDSMFNYNRYRNYKSAVVLHTGPLNSNRLQVFTFLFNGRCAACFRDT